MSGWIQHPRAVVISDLHMGDPASPSLDPFECDGRFATLLDEVIPKTVGPATLIINGDFIDFPRILPERARESPKDRLGATQGLSREKMDRVIERHKEVFQALNRYLNGGGQVLLLPGNHDPDLYWGGVREQLYEAVGRPEDPGLVAEAGRTPGPGRLDFVAEAEIEEQGLYIVHGHQYSYDNSFRYWPPDHERPIVTWKGVEYLERPWGTMFLDVLFNDIQARDRFVNEVYPHERLFGIALRSLGRRPFSDHKEASWWLAIRLACFLARKGKRLGWQHALGASGTPGAMSNAAVVARALDEVGCDLLGEERQKLTAEAAELLAQEEMASGPVPAPAPAAGPVGKFLGRTDESGMNARAREILLDMRARIVVFGHTHQEIDGRERPFLGPGRPGRIFNTGSWIHRIALGESESPRWDELATRSGDPAIFYLVVELARPTEAELRPLK
jgi:UDP-2,3-diacylglucosamine pyrophosphatase LpxH